jgi:hypothetical protein
VKSIELRNYNEKHGCAVLEEVDGNKLHVGLIPPIPAWVYGTDEDMRGIVLAPRYAGTSLVPVISEWPFTANICIPKPDGNWVSGPWRLLDIGLLEMAMADRNLS